MLSRAAARNGGGIGSGEYRLQPRSAAAVGAGVEVDPHRALGMVHVEDPVPGRERPDHRFEYRCEGPVADTGGASPERAERLDLREPSDRSTRNGELGAGSGGRSV